MEQLVYIAAPFFNEAQRAIVEKIETICFNQKLPFYSPRLHSGSASLTDEQKKQHASWKPVLKSNIDALHQCTLLIAVIEYALEPGWVLGLYDPMENAAHAELQTYGPPLEIPDTGVVWECGYRHALNYACDYLPNSFGPEVPIIGFHTTKQPDKLNLMMSHTLNGYVQGYKNLQMYLEDGSEGGFDDYGVLKSFSKEVI